MASPHALLSDPARHLWRRARALGLAGRVAAHTRDLALLRSGLDLQAISRECFGWVTPHRTRWWEYPWVLRQVLARRDGVPASALESGAGRSPVAVALQRAGLAVTVADPDSQAATGRTSGGEWDWTDYGRWGIPSVRAGMEDAVVPAGSLGFVLSVSVIEHVPSAVRRAGLARFAEALAPGGCFVTTVDLFRGTEDLWNRLLDAEVEPREVHGTVDTLVAEAAAEGLQLDSREACPVSTDQHDILGLVFRRA